MDKLIIFDCDGVLVDSEVVAHKAGVGVFQDYGYNISLEESIKIFTGMNSNSIHEYVLRESGIHIPMEIMESQVLNALKTNVTEGWHTNRKIYPSSVPVRYIIY